MWLFTTIIHPVRKQFGLTEKEYCIIDTIAQLSANPSASFKGWCNASNGTIADFLDTTAKTVIATIEKAIALGLIEVQPASVGEIVKKRATKHWYDSISMVMPKTLPITKSDTLLPKVTPPITKSNTPLLPKVTPPITFGNTDNNLDIDIDNNIDKSYSDFFEKSQKNPLSDSDFLPTKETKKEEKEKKVAPKKEKEEVVQLDSEAEQILQDAKNGSRQPTAIEIAQTPTPNGVNHGVFFRLRQFGAARQMRTRKEKRMTLRAWENMISALKTASITYQPQELMLLLDYAIAKQYDSPFFAGYQDLIPKLKNTNHANNNNQPAANTQRTTSEKLRDIGTKIQDRIIAKYGLTDIGSSEEL